ncbi:MAG: trypsin-like peptidase domain-containing protein [Pseudomonadota bacterium]
MQRTLHFLLQVVITGLAVAFVLVWFRPELLPSTQSSASQARPAVQSYSDAVNRTAPSIVSIYTRTVVNEPLVPPNEPVTLHNILMRDYRVERQRGGLGSGVIVSSEGIILTTAHVIEGVDNIFVALFDGRVAEAEVIGTDPDSDLAVLKVDLEGLPSATFNTDAPHRPGDVVLAIGNAFGLNHTVTLGIVSATGRSDLNLSTYEDFIQTDAAVNSGNSGGALINPDGEVIGINSASLSQNVGAQGISFAISARIATEVLDQILQYGEVRRGWIGADLSDPPLLQTDQNQPSGVQISQVYRHGPAWIAGLRRGDILLSANGEPVGSAREFTLRVANLPAGEELEFQALRNGQQFTTSVRLIQQPPLQS